MSSDWLQVLGALLIIGFMVYAIFRGGTQNPVGTGSLQRQLNTIGGKVEALKTKVEGCALTSELETIRADLRAMEERVASSGELLALQGQFASLRAEVAGLSAIGSRTEEGVRRIEGYFLERGINGR